MKRNPLLTRWFERGSTWGLLGGYGIAAWVVLQVTDTLGSLIGLPLWFGKVVIGLLVGGLVIVLMTSLLQASLAPESDEGSATRTRLRRMFTWRRAAIVGVAGFALLGVGTAGYMSARAMGVGPPGTLMARGDLPDQPQLVIADFEDHNGDPGVARALTQAFRVHLSQSPVVTLASRATVAEVLERMQMPADTPLTAEIAREVAIREGLEAAVTGELHAVGSRYTVSARLVAAESGEELGEWIESADTPDELIRAVERLSVRMRERIGEQLKSVRRSPPLSRVRTSSLAALRNYTEGVDANSRGDFEKCALLMEQAIELDSMFANAYVGRAGCNQNLARDMAQQVSDRIRAFSMRHRMTDEERLRFTAVYQQFVADDREQAVEAWEAYAERYPEMTSAIFALANLYAEGRDWVRAEATLNRGLELDPSSVVVLINLVGYQINQGRMAAAESTFARLELEVPGLDAAWWRATLALSLPDFATAETGLVGASDRARANLTQRARIASLQSMVVLTLGRVDEAERYAREAAAADLEAGSIEWYHLRAVDIAMLQLEVRRDTAAALATIDAALAAHPLESLDPFERRYLEIAELLARAGRIDRARSLIENWEVDVAPLIPGTVRPHWLRAALAEAERRWDDAIAEWRLDDAEREDPLPALARIGYAHDHMARADSAIAYYGRYLTTPSRARWASDPYWRAFVLERLARLHEDRGEAGQAAGYYGQFVELWAEADPFLQPRVAAARSRLTPLAGG